jgi:hypothetical protein
LTYLDPRLAAVVFTISIYGSGAAHANGGRRASSSISRAAALSPSPTSSARRPRRFAPSRGSARRSSNRIRLGASLAHARPSSKRGDWGNRFVPSPANARGSLKRRGSRRFGMTPISTSRSRTIGWSIRPVSTFGRSRTLERSGAVPALLGGFVALAESGWAAAAALSGHGSSTRAGRRPPPGATLSGRLTPPGTRARRRRAGGACCRLPP